MQEEWYDKLRKQMESHEEKAPEGLWDNIEQTMLHQQVATKRRKRIVAWTTSVSAIAATVALLFLLRPATIGPAPENTLAAVSTEMPTATPQRPMYGSMSPTLQNMAYTDDTTSTAQETESAILSEELREKAQKIYATSSAQSEVLAYAPRSRRKVSTPQRAVSTTKVPANRSEDVDAVTDSNVPVMKTSVVNDSANAQGNDNLTPTKQAQRVSQHTSTTRDAMSVKRFPPYQHTPSQHRLSANIYGANALHATHRTAGYSELIRGASIPEKVPTGFGEKTSDKEIIYANLGRQTYTEKTHRLPIRTGISIRYALNHHWSIESGLSYSYLQSFLTAGSETHHYKTTQQLHYIGIPIAASYRIWDNRNWELYASAGTLLEQCVSGQYETDYILESTPNNSTQATIDKKPFQCSVNVALGVQYNLSSLLGIYLEPNVHYYFDDGSDIETIYKEHPLNLNLKLGLRVQF